MSYPLIVAEIGANHNGDMALAKKLIKSNEQYLGDDIIEVAINKIDEDKKEKEDKKNVRQKEKSKRKVGNK